MPGCNELGRDPFGPALCVDGEVRSWRVERYGTLAASPGLGLRGEALESLAALGEEERSHRASGQPARLDLDLVNTLAPSPTVRREREAPGEPGERAALEQAGVLEPVVADPVGRPVVPGDGKRPDPALPRKSWVPSAWAISVML